MHDIFIVNNCNNYAKLVNRYPHARIIKPSTDLIELYRHVAASAVTKHAWIISDACNYDDFDFGFEPLWHQADQLHVWPSGSQQRGGQTCLINAQQFLTKTVDLDAIQNYQSVCWHNESIPLQTLPDIVIWNVPGTEHNLAVLQKQYPQAKTLRYVGNHLEMLKKSLRYTSSEGFWIINSGCNYSNFDLSWQPGWEHRSSLHCWANGSQKFGDTFYVPRSEFAEIATAIEELDYYPDIVWHESGYPQIHKADIVIWNVPGFEDNLKKLQNLYPQAKTLRYVGSHLEMIKKSLRYAETKNFWTLSSNCDYSNFDPLWLPSWASRKQLHCWASSKQQFGDTFYVSRSDFEFAAENISELDYYPGIVWHKDGFGQLETPSIVIWDFGGHRENLKALEEQYPAAKTLRYIGSHLEMLKKSLRYAETKNFWVISSCCDYSNFDPLWLPSWASRKQLHCWASGTQKFGDTFYVSRSDFEFAAETISELDYYPGIVWHEDGFKRFSWPINYTNCDLLTALKSHKFSSIYEYFVMPGSEIGSTVDPCLWQKRHLIAYNNNGHVSLCPRDCISQISVKVNDYPYIQYHNCKNSTEKPQDIVFISYDEKHADLNYEILKKRFPSALRVHGVKGNVAAYKAAAHLSTTPWYYAVFPKTEITNEFEFNYHPNYLEQLGHYIFYAHNSITNYSYGHGGVKMYHVKTTVEIENWGYDFTMSSPVTTIPVISCINNPATPFEAWRTSFREALKLRAMTTVESKYRLHRWLNIGHGEFGEYSKKGAAAAMTYNGDPSVANSWEWLRDYFDSVVD